MAAAHLLPYIWFMMTPIKDGVKRTSNQLVVVLFPFYQAAEVVNDMKKAVAGICFFFVFLHVGIAFLWSPDMSGPE